MKEELVVLVIIAHFGLTVNTIHTNILAIYL